MLPAAVRTTIYVILCLGIGQIRKDTYLLHSSYIIFLFWWLFHTLYLSFAMTYLLYFFIKIWTLNCPVVAVLCRLKCRHYLHQCWVFFFFFFFILFHTFLYERNFNFNFLLSNNSSIIWLMRGLPIVHRKLSQRLYIYIILEL